MIVGNKYKLIYRTPYQRKDRISVARFLEETATDYLFDARPQFGTQKYPKKWVQSIVAMPNEAEIIVNVLS